MSINVLSDKTRAMVDAMEKTLGATRKEMEGSIVLLRKDMELLRTSMTVRLGSMLAVTASLLFAALKFT